jgi:peptide/nickel transport system ATP-binding protein
MLDESTASLDVSVRARVLDLLAQLQQDLGLT